LIPRGFRVQTDTSEEKTKVVANCDHLAKLKFSSTLPNAFTEHGALMVASVLNTPRGVEVSIFVVKTFIQLRQLLFNHADQVRKLEKMEKKYDAQFKVVFEAIRQFMTPLPKSKPKIGFQLKENKRFMDRKNCDEL
jgi:hypothetical protein